jgi:hypothetical protein
MTSITQRPAAAIISPTTATTMLIAGAAATIAFDLFGQALAPMLGYAKLAPGPLATAVFKTVFGTAPKGIGHLIHVLTGLLAYPLAWALIVRPLAARVAPGLHWSVPAALYGVALWVFALYGMAHVIAGNPPFLGFSGITWVALWGHILFALVAAGVIEHRMTRDAAW